VRIDPLIVGDQALGWGSEFVLNDRAGMLLTGAGTDLLVHGADVAGNLGGGVLLQHGAASRDGVAYSRFRQNAGLGFGAFDGSWVGSFQCNYFPGNLLHTLSVQVAGASAAVAFGEGLVLSPGASTPTMQLTRNHFNSNGRYGALLDRVSVDMDNNDAVGNVSGAMVTTDRTQVTGADVNSVADLAPGAATVPAGVQGLVVPTIVAP
jgi:hypothetical protein